MKKIFILSIASICYSLLFLNACKKTDPTDNNPPTATHPYGAGKGQITIYTATDLGQGPITCYFDGQSAGTITHYSANTTCGSGDVNTILTAGTHSFTATSQAGPTWNATITIAEDLCTKQPLTYTGGGGGGGTATGNAIFYLNQSSPGGTVTVNCGGQTKNISTYFTSTPACGTANAANFTLPVGTYNYTASTSAQTWSGSITITTNGCSSNLLTINGSSNIGHLTVWSSNTSVGTITVTCGGLTRYVTSKYSSAPSCQASGCAIFDLPFGNYTINASAAGGASWNPYPISISTTGQCYQVGLQ